MSSSNPYVTVQVKCAVCERVKGETNHWFAVRDSRHLGDDVYRYFYEVLAFSLELLGRDFDLQPVCGESCLTKLEQQIRDRATAKVTA